MGNPIDQAVFIVGGLLLEQAPKALLLSDGQLEQYYEPALQDYKDLIKADYKIVFEAPAGFRQLVMDHVRRYLDLARMRFEI